MYSRKSFSLISVCVSCEVSHLILEFALSISLQGLIEGFCNECDREVYLTQHMFNYFALKGNQEQPVDSSGGHQCTSFM